ncbi:MAG: MFS transporter [Anaerolineae bacterium]|jgi:DHA1 family tetracycline resistance protein-like MFS transporter|nr:MFS transporter [Anaerolineae bacterium]
MTTTPLKPDEKLDFKRILPIFVIVLVDLMGLTIIIPLLPLYAVTFGADALTIGLLGATYPLMQLVGAPLLAGLSDRYGRKPVLMVSQVGTFCGFLLLGVANTLPLIFLARFIDGLTGANTAVAQAAITDSTTPATRAQGLGLIGAAFGLGFTMGPAIAGISLALTNNDFHVPALIAAGFSLLSVILTGVWFKETLPAAQRHTLARQNAGGGHVLQRIAAALRSPLIGMLLVLMFMQQLIFGGFEQLFTLFSLTRLGMDGAGNAAMFLYIGVIVVIIQGKYIGDLRRTYGEHTLIHASLVLLGIGLIGFALTPPVPVPWYSQAAVQTALATSAATGSEGVLTGIALPLPPDGNNGVVGFVWMLVAVLPVSIGGAMLSPLINSLITRRISAGSVGGALGVSSALNSLANAVTPLLGGALFQFLGPGSPFILGGLLCGLLLWLALRRIPPVPEDEAPATAVAAAH